MRSRRRPSSHGFTLIELLTVIVIVAVLAAVAVPGYRSYVEKARRADAKVALNQAALLLERCFTQFGAYDHEDCTVESPVDSPEGYYSIEAVREAGTYTLTAAPQGPQASDTRCGTFTLDHEGARSASGTSPDDCW